VERAPRVTVITPSLNQAAFIERTIRSVLDQNYENLEYVVIDGGSSDGSRDIIERYSDRIAYWVSEPDNGQSHAINKGIARATGEFVAYINSDDYLLPGAIRALSDPLRKDSSAVWSAGACRYEHDDGSVERIWRPALPVGPSRQIIESVWYVPQASSLWRREVFERLGGLREDLQYVFDTEFTVRLALAGIMPVLVSQEVAVRFLHDAAKSAAPQQFVAEWARVKREFAAQLGPADDVAYLAFRIRRRLGRAWRRGGRAR
jgi:glycosyltransferase involved in cell wall biosynthesis